MHCFMNFLLCTICDQREELGEPEDMFTHDTTLQTLEESADQFFFQLQEVSC